MILFSHERGDFRFSDDASFPAEDESWKIKEMIMDDPELYGPDAIHRFGDAEENLYTVLLLALQDNRPIEERFFDIRNLCEEIIEAYAKDESEKRHD